MEMFKTLGNNYYSSFDLRTTDGSYAITQKETTSENTLRLFSSTIADKTTEEDDFVQGDELMIFGFKEGYAVTPKHVLIEGNKNIILKAIRAIEMVLVQGGTFTMGCTSEQGEDCEDNESPAHQVTLNSFYIGKYEVTQALWEEVMEMNIHQWLSFVGGESWGIYGEGNNYPMYYVNWNDIVGTSGTSIIINGITYYENGFIYKLRQKTGKRYRLPTEAEWEYAARGGVKSNQYKYSGSNDVGDVAWHYGNTIPDGARHVGSKQDNELGIYDMSGNVWEWCSDLYGSYTSDPQNNPTGPTTGSYHVHRGGSWYYSYDYCRVSYHRAFYYPVERSSALGFRLAEDITIAENSMTVSVSELNFPASGDEQTFTITSNIDWIIEYECSWLTISPVLGNNNGTISVTASENTSQNPRTKIIMIKGIGVVEQLISVTQAGDANGDKIEMVFVQGGTFTMGCASEQGDNCEDNEHPEHQVTLNNFYIGKYEITQGLWAEIMGMNIQQWTDYIGSSYLCGEGDDYPMYYISWDDIVGTTGESMEINGITYYENGFIYKLNQKTGKNYRLPTESEWEYASRGGVKSNYYKYSGSNSVDDVAWHVDNSGFTAHLVGAKQDNELGIYDMSGNVWEWCSDWYGSYTSDPQNNPTGPTTGSNRVLRGGCWSAGVQYCRVAFRFNYTPSSRFYSIGFRIVLIP